MEFIDNIIQNIQNADDPTVYYIIGGLMLIVLFMFVRRMLYIGMFLVAVVTLYVGWCFYTGQPVDFSHLPQIDLEKMIDVIQDFFSGLMGAAENVNDVTGASEMLNDVVDGVE